MFANNALTIISIILCINKINSLNRSFQDHTEISEVMWVPRVVNGWVANLGDVPYQVALKARSSRHKPIYRTFCGATIVAPTKLISAAHCFEENGITCEKLFNPGRAAPATFDTKYAVAGNLRNRATYSNDGPTSGQWRKIHSVHYPVSYKFPRDDISVVFLKEPFFYDSYVASIPTAQRHIEYRGQCLVSGYGRTGKIAQTERLLLAYLEIMPTHVCSNRHQRNMINFVCTSSVLTDVGKGDSGGPLICRNTGDPKDIGQGVLVGVVSGHKLGAGSFFTRVSSYQNFISSCNSNKILPNKFSIVVISLACLIKISFLLF